MPLCEGLLRGEKGKCFGSIPQTHTALLKKLALNDPLQSHDLFFPKSPLSIVHLSSCASGWQTGRRVRFFRDWKPYVLLSVLVLPVCILCQLILLTKLFVPVSVYNWLIFYLWLWVSYFSLMLIVWKAVERGVLCLSSKRKHGWKSEYRKMREAD